VYAIEQELAAWILAVNANNPNAQVAIEKGYSDGSGNYNGLVLSFGAEGTADKAYMSTHSTTTSNWIWEASDTWLNNGTNGGYGDIQGQKVGDTSRGFATTSSSGANFIIAYDTEPGKEFFAMGPSISSNFNYEDGWIVYKDTRNIWNMLSNDGTTYYHLTYFPDDVSPKWGSFARRTSSSTVSIGTVPFRLSVYASSTTPNSTLTGVMKTYAANEALRRPRGSGLNRTGHRYIYTTLGNGKNTYSISLWYSGPCLFVEP